MRPKRMIETLVWLLFFYILFSPRIALPFYNTMIFYPHKYPTGQYELESIEGIPRKDVYFASSNGKRLHGWFFNRADGGPTVLISHGNAGNLSYRAGLCALVLKGGASVMVYDYQGYGRSEGSPSLRGILEDGLAAHNYLVEQEKVPPARIVHMGESLGSLVASHMSATRPCGGVVLQSGLATFKRIALEALPYLAVYPSWLFPGPELDNGAVFEKPHPPLLLVHGVRDDIVSIGHSEELYKRAVGPKTLVRLPDAGHNDIYSVNADQYQAALARFFEESRERSAL